MRTIIKGDDVDNIYTIRTTETNFNADKLEILFSSGNKTLTKTIINPSLPVNISLSKEETSQLGYINKVFVIKYNDYHKQTYLGCGELKADDAPLCGSIEETETNDIILTDAKITNSDIINLSLNGGGGEPVSVEGVYGYHCFTIENGDLILNYETGKPFPNFSIEGEDLVLEYDGVDVPSYAINENGELEIEI